jgi:hypothetical protein
VPVVLVDCWQPGLSDRSTTTGFLDRAFCPHRHYPAPTGSLHFDRTSVGAQSISEGRDVETEEVGAKWTTLDEAQLRSLARGNTPTRVMGLKLERSETSVRSKAQELNVSPKPTNQSPYNRRKT